MQLFDNETQPSRNDSRTYVLARLIESVKRGFLDV